MVLRKGVFPYFMILLLAAAGCKSQNQTSTTYKAYHDLTARYNRYFNSKMIFFEAFKQIEEQHKDDYNELLPLYLYHDLESPQTYYPQMDQVIKKESANLQLHENSKWSDDSYLHIGMANYIKGNYEESLKAFTIITSDIETGVRENPSKTDNARTSGKEDEYNPYFDGNTAFLKHKPARYEAILWIVRNYVQLEKYSEAQSVLALARGDKTFPDQLRDELHKTEAFYYLNRDDHARAAESIKKCIEYTKDKKEQRRYFFILGQLHERSANFDAAIQYYRQVLDMQPSYEMEFEARIKIAELGRKTNKYGAEYVINMLDDMLKNEHYEDFRGRIYYTLAELYLNEGMEEEAVKNFSLSVQHSEGNDDQKANAYYQLAEYYFEKENYVISKKYHDSTLTFFDREDPKFDSINTRKNTLSGIVEQVNIITLQDSLLRLSQFSEEEIEALRAKNENRKSKEEENKRREEEEEESFEPLIPEGEEEISSRWPFDKPEMRSRGYNDFRQVWGERPHIELWRVKETSNSIATLPEEEEEEEVAEEEIIASDTTEMDQSIFDNVPQTPEEIEAAHGKMAAAYYKLADLYKEDLDNIPRAIETYETLMTKFPQNDYRMETAYRLYLLYQGKNEEKANHYKGIVLNEYPNSTLAKVIENPDYFKEQEKEIDQAQTYYAQTYHAFKADQFENVLQRVARADSVYPGNELAPKFHMLEALTYGKMQKYDSMRTELEDIVNKYPFDDVKTRALAILNSMEGMAYGSTDGTGGAGQFKYEPASPHYLAILFYAVGDTVQKVQEKLADYNGEYHSLDKLKIKSMLLTNEAQLVLVQDFNNAKKAKGYYNEIRYNKEVFGDLAKDKYEVFFISPHNYGVFYREKNVDTYMTFFTKEYLDKD